MISAYQDGEQKTANPEDDYAFETLQKIQGEKDDRREEKRKAKESKSKPSKKVVKF